MKMLGFYIQWGKLSTKDMKGSRCLLSFKQLQVLLLTYEELRVLSGSVFSGSGWHIEIKVSVPAFPPHLPLLCASRKPQPWSIDLPEYTDGTGILLKLRVYNLTPLPTSKLTLCEASGMRGVKGQGDTRIDLHISHIPQALYHQPHEFLSIDCRIIVQCRAR